jgi:hypothetical protein
MAICVPRAKPLDSAGSPGALRDLAQQQGHFKMICAATGLCYAPIQTMLQIAGVILAGWIGMFALILGMRMSIAGLRPPPYPEWFRILFEALHNIAAGVAGGWLCARGGKEAIFCAVLLAAWCAGLEVTSLKLGWTTFERAHSISGIVLAPLSVVVTALVLS